MGWQLTKFPKDHPLIAVPWHLSTTWPGMRALNFRSLEHLWHFWAEKACFRLETVRTIATIGRHYAQADLHSRAEMRFFIFDNFYSPRPVPRPQMLWDEEVYPLRIQNLPRDWKARMRKHQLAHGPDFYFRDELVNELGKIDQCHPQPVWVERILHVQAPNRIELRARL
jgi:hypothetical protein